MINSKLKKIDILEPSHPNKSTGIINGVSSGVLNWNDIAYPSFYRTYSELLDNFWRPNEVDMKDDAKMFPKLKQSKKDVYKMQIGTLASLDTPQAQFMFLLSMYITDSAASEIFRTIAFQEGIHNQSYSYAGASIMSLKEQNEMFELPKRYKSVVDKNEPIMKAYYTFRDNPTPYNLVRALVQSSILEGINFYTGFTFFYDLKRQQEMTGTAKDISYINRDELVHSKFVSEVLRAILGENPELNNDEFMTYTDNAFVKGVELEIAFARDSLSREDTDVDGSIAMINHRAYKMLKMLNADTSRFREYSENPLPWTNAYVDQFNETKADFFESKVTDYKKVGDDNGFDEL